MSTTWLRNTPDGLLTGLDDTGTHVPLEAASYRRLVTPDGKVWILAGGEPETKGYPEFDPNQPRDDHGRWGGGGGTATAESALGGESKLSGLTKLLADPDSGFTVSMRTGLSPEHGYVVSIYPDRSKAVAKGDVTLAALAEYVKANRDLLAQPGHHFGAWHDPKDGTVYLDVSVVVPTADEAETLARDHDQIAYFDLQTMKSVDVNRAATSGGQKPVPAGAASGKLARVRSAHGQAEDQGDLAADADAGGLGGVGHGTHGPVTHGGRDRRGAEAPGGRHGPILKYSDDQPRVPAGHPDGGQWTDGGGDGAGSATATADAPKADPNAALFNPYGRELDAWSKETIVRLDQEAATAMEAMGRLEAKLREEGAVSDKGGAQTWDELDSSIQQQAEEYFISNNIESQMDSEGESWSEGLRDEVKEDAAWQAEQFKEWLKPETNEDTGEPYDVPDIDPKSITEDAMLTGGKIDPEKLIWLRDNPDQLEMALGDTTDPSARWAAWQESWMAYYDDRLNEEVEKRTENPPEYLHDSAMESLQEYFSDMDDEEKYNIALKSGYEPDGEVTDVDFPDSWTPDDLLSGDADHKAAAHALVQARFEELASQRGFDASDYSDLGDELWEGWKDSSSSKNGLYIQVGTAQELGGRLQETPAVKDFLEHHDEGRLDAAKAYVRATWETNQYLLAKAGVKEMPLYRGVMLPKDMLDQTTNETVSSEDAAGGGPYTRLPDLTLRVNGAQSTTYSVHVANGWNGVGVNHDEPERVVLRLRTPAHAIISLPVYGKNIHSEKEVVVAGLPFYAWDAWRERAPQADYYKIKGVAGLVLAGVSLHQQGVMPHG